MRILWGEQHKAGGKTRVVPRVVTHNHFTDDETDSHKEVTYFVTKKYIYFSM